MKSLRSAFAILAVVPLLLAAATEGYFGLVMDVSAGGSFLSPVIESAKIKALPPGTPAAVSGIAVGDEIITLDDRKVAGAKAAELKPLLHKAVGERLHLVLRRPNGETYSAVLVAVPKPE